MEVTEDDDSVDTWHVIGDGGVGRTIRGAIQVGTPTVSGVKVSATILEHLRGDKIRVFKKKRRKGYRKTIGHRQDFTKVQITAIG